MEDIDSDDELFASLSVVRPSSSSVDSGAVKRQRVDALERAGWRDGGPLEPLYAEAQQAEAAAAAAAAAAEAAAAEEPPAPVEAPAEAPVEVTKKKLSFNRKEKRSRSMRGENDFVQEQKRILRRQTDGF